MGATLVIQARMGSTRLPGKVMKDLSGNPVLWHVIDRCKRARLIEKIIMATTTNPEDDPLATYAESIGCPVFRGSSDDVLKRYCDAIDTFNGDPVVRITSDCPLIDPEIIDLVVAGLEKYDYVTNVFERTFPRGLDVEVFTSSALHIAAQEATSQYDREHVTPYIREHPDRFSSKNIAMPVAYHAANCRLTLDTIEDYQFLNEIFSRMYTAGEIISVPKVIQLIHELPELANLNNTVLQKPDPIR